MVSVSKIASYFKTRSVGFFKQNMGIEEKITETENYNGLILYKEGIFYKLYNKPWRGHKEKISI